jgi:ATP-dependent helicase/nuclease subunit A
MTERSDTPDTGVFGRVLVTASAGSGKTYQLSSRLVGLLAAGAPPDSILASTFTRKAAGEILERVLLRLARAALDPREAAALADSLPAGVPPERTTPEAFSRLLREVVGSLHRLQVQTLDAFVNRVVRAFALELGLPPGFDMGDEPDHATLRGRAVEEVLREGDPGFLGGLVRLVRLGGADRAVHRDLLSAVQGIHALWRERDPAAPDPWGFENAGTRWPALPASRWEELAEGVAAAGRRHLEETGPTRNLEGALGRIDAALRSGDAGAVVKETLWRNALAEDADPPKYSGKEIHPALVEAFRAVARDLPALVGPAFHRQMEALGRLLPAWDTHLSRLRRARGLFGFDDLVHALAAGGALGAADALYYRLDARIRHVLLDEFQDTSTRQWAALEPLVDELLSGYAGERALFVVGDPKQSIYGWRGGEPRLLDDLRARPGLAEDTLARSWRSSPVVLDFVNRTFRDLPAHPVLSDGGDAEVAARWMEGFALHEAARPELPGRVEIASGPDAPDGAARAAALLERAADRVVELHRLHPGMEIGILVRKNATGARMMALLRERGVEASEEGGVPVADAPAVVAILALLRAADHPGDRISAYLVARSPLGPALGLRDYRDPRAVERVGRRIRAELLAEGYGPVVARLARALRPGASARELRRLDQLVALAFEGEGRATLRPSDFVHRVRSARREDPATAPVRIMTIHRSKGLEFDAVVLPELDGGGRGGGGLGATALPLRRAPGGPVERILPDLPKDLAPFFPDVEAAREARDEGVLRDWLSGLYVGVTRARHALFLFLPPDGKTRTSARSWARLLREAPGLRDPEGFGPDEGPVPEAFDGKGRLLPSARVFTAGDPEWWRGVEGRREADAPTRNRAPVPMAPSPRRRLLPVRTPSELEGGRKRPLGDFLRSVPEGAAERGTLVHAWLEEVGWLDEGAPPPDAALRATARRVAPRMGGPELDALVARFAGWIAAPEARRFLDRGGWPEGTEPLREVPFVARDEGGILHGKADRVLRIPRKGTPGRVDRLVVVDWKTDEVAEGERGARAGYYRPQMEAYLRALARVEGVEPGAVEGWIVFLPAGRAVEVTLGGEAPARGPGPDPEGG